MKQRLVITDDTMQFSPSGQKSQPWPQSFVAEIVNQDCVGRALATGGVRMFD